MKVNTVFDYYVDQLNKLQDINNQYNAEMRSLYMQYVFLSWRWWLCIALAIVPWVFWFIIRKKESTARLLFSGFIVTIIAMLLDDIGVELSFWDYHVDIDAINPSFILWDMSLLPVATMVFLQFKPRINPFIKAVVFAATAAFVVEPIFVWLDFYDPNKWEHIISFPIFIAIYLIAHFCSTRKSFEMLK